MNDSITITVPWIPILVGLAVFSLVQIIRKVFRGKMTRRQQRFHQKQVVLRQKIQRFFPSPWDDAYERCSNIDDNPQSREFLKAWLAERTVYRIDLPRLSSDAIHEFACELTFEYCDMWNECLGILAPYSEEQEKDLAAEKVLLEKDLADKKALFEKELAEKKALFLYPWDTAYEACRDTGTWSGAQNWLRKWIDEQSSLPHLSVAAAEELMSHVSNRKNKDEYRACFSMVAPYLDTGYAPHRDFGDYNLEQQLPEEWFKFWKELKDYPSRRSLFLEKLARYKDQPPHPVFHVPLTTEQAALLSRALGGGNETVTNFYASDLTGCISIEWGC